MARTVAAGAGRAASSMAAGPSMWSVRRARRRRAQAAADGRLAAAYARVEELEGQLVEERLQWVHQSDAEVQLRLGLRARNAQGARPRAAPKSEPPTCAGIQGVQ